MIINYSQYMVFPFTSLQLSKKYSKDVLNKYGDQLAFLYQNGFDLSGNTCIEQVEEQLGLFNFIKTYEDFYDLLETTAKIEEPSPVGYKIVDSVLEAIIKNSSWAIKRLHDIKTLGDMYSDSMIKLCNVLGYVLDSNDIEVSGVVNEMFDDKTLSLYDKCLENIEDGLNNLLIINYQRMYFNLIKIHQNIVKRLGNSVTKGEMSRMGNINDELYGSAGGYNPQNNEVKFFKGSALYELNMLTDTNKFSDKDLLDSKDLLFLCKECISNKDSDPLLVSFAKGDKTHVSEVRKALADICFNGIFILLCLKHNLSLDELDTLNEKRAEKIMHELNAICKITGYYTEVLQ